MATQKQKREIKKLMRAIKDKTDADAPQKEVKDAVNDLTDYLQEEGIINPFRDDD